MSNVLYIIGNGFDIHHRLSTKYCHYFLYLRKKYPNILNDMNASKFFNGVDTVDIDGSSPEDYNKLWSNLEMMLEFAYEDYFEETVDCYAPDYAEEHPNFGGVIFQVDDDKAPFSKFTNDYLIEWIKLAESGKCVKDNSLNLSSKNYYLSFNYTNTLQSFYNVPDAKILHIHGSLKENFENGRPLQFGNPESSAKCLQQRLENKYADHPCGSWVTDAIHGVVDLCKALTKNPKQNYEPLKFFIQNKSFGEVVVMGHSFMGVDRPYYDDVIVPCLEKCKWKFFYHNENDKDYIQQFKQAHPTICVNEEHW